MNRESVRRGAGFSAACLACVQIAWAGEPAMAPAGPELRERWVEAIRSVEPLWTAVAACLEKNQGVAANNCDSVGALRGGNAASLKFWQADTLPALDKYGGTVTTLVPGTAQISIASLGPALGNCAVLLTPKVADTGLATSSTSGATVSWTVSQVDSASCAATVIGAGKRTMAWAPSSGH